MGEKTFEDYYNSYMDRNADSMSSEYFGRNKKQTSALQTLLEASGSLSSIHKFFIETYLPELISHSLKDAKRKIQYTKKQIYTPILTDVIIEDHEITDRWPILPKLEERLLDNPEEKIIRTNKYDREVSQIKITERTVPDPLPPQPIVYVIKVPYLFTDLMRDKKLNKKYSFLIDVMMHIFSDIAKAVWEDNIELRFDGSVNIRDDHGTLIHHNTNDDIINLLSLSDIPHISVNHCKALDIWFNISLGFVDVDRFHNDYTEDVIGIDLLYKYGGEKLDEFVIPTSATRNVDFTKSFPAVVDELMLGIMLELESRYDGIDFSRIKKISRW